MADVRGIDFSDITVQIFQNNNQVSSVSSANALGNPLRSVAWLANELAKYGECLEAGEIVLSGGLNPPVHVKPGDRFSADFGRLGRIQTTII